MLEVNVTKQLNNNDDAHIIQSRDHFEDAVSQPSSPVHAFSPVGKIGRKLCEGSSKRAMGQKLVAAS